MKEIKKWWRDLSRTDYLITKQQNLGWMIFVEDGETKKIRIISPTFVLSEWQPIGKNRYSSQLDDAKLYPKWYGKLILSWLKMRGTDQMKFNLMRKEQALFETDLTGLVAN